MDMPGFHRTSNLLTMFLCLVLACVTAAGTFSLVQSVPAESTCIINTPPPATEGIPYTYTFLAYSQQPCTNCRDDVMAILSVTPALPAGMYWLGTTLMGNPPPGSAGTYQICFYCQEWVPKPYAPPWTPVLEYPCKCIPGGNPPCYPANPCCACKCTTFIIQKPVQGGGNQQQQQQQQQQTVIIAPPAAPSTAPSYKYTVSVVGLAGATAPVSVDGNFFADMTGGESRTLDGATGKSYSVSAPGSIQGKAGTRYVMSGSGNKTANANNTSVTFTYNAEYQINIKTFPDGIALLPGSGWVPAGSQVSSSAPPTVKKDNNTDFVFSHWATPKGESRYTSLSVTADAPGDYTAYYDTKSVAQPCSMDFLWIIILILAVIVTAIILAVSRRKSTAGQATTVVKSEELPRIRAEAPVEQQPTPSKATPGGVSRFCPNCGDGIKPGEKFCDKCGTKLEDKERPLNCPKCGDPIAKGEIFCDKCGFKLV